MSALVLIISITLLDKPSFASNGWREAYENHRDYHSHSFLHDLDKDEIPEIIH